MSRTESGQLQQFVFCENDRFGFRFDNGASLVERAEWFQSIMEENLAESELTAEEVETRWKDMVVGLGRPRNILVNKETKALIRRGKKFAYLQLHQVLDSGNQLPTLQLMSFFCPKVPPNSGKHCFCQ